MKKIFAAIFILMSTQILAQDSLQNFNNSRNHITITGMKVLGSWGIANIGVGAAGWASANNTSTKYFYQMNTFWGAANVGAAVLGFTGSQRNLKKQLSATDNLQAQKNIERTFLINGGLDVAYIGTGIFLNHRGISRDDARLKGYGSSVMMQGIFLLVFDGTMYSVQRSNGNKFRQFFNKNSITFSGNSIGIVHTM